MRIEAAAARAGRSPESVTLIGVSKFQPVEAMYAAVACGIKILGENRVQECAEKSAKWTGPPVSWHMIGHLQRNKARRAVELFDCVQSVDGVELASVIDRIVDEKNRSQYPVLLEINTSGEASKSGAPPEECFSLVEHVLTGCKNLSPDGLMTIGPLTDDEREVRASFALLRDLAEGARRRFGIALPHLSMGMTGDYEWAIEEGGTIVRIGTGIFGARHI
jgi:pyridoxal phosphate enzyme (YggS family)